MYITLKASMLLLLLSEFSRTGTSLDEPIWHDCKRTSGRPFRLQFRCDSVV